MRNKIRFGELRRLLLDVGFQEVSGPKQIIFQHLPSNTLFVFRAYRPSDPVTAYNLVEVKDMLDSRGLMSADAFESQFRKTPA